MVQRNIELEKKAWELVEQQRRSTNFQEPPPTYSSVVYSNEETALQQTLELSKREYDLKIAAEEEELRKLIAMAEAQWVTGGQQQSVPMAPVPTDVPVMAAVPDVPVMATVPDVPVMAAVPDVPVLAAVPDVPVMATVPDVPVMAAVPDVPVMAAVPDVPVLAAVPDVPVMAAVPDVPVMATVPDVPVMAAVPDVPVLAAVPDVPVLAEPGSTTGETWSDGGHTPQIQAEAIMATVDYTSQGPDPTHPELSETEEFDFDYTSQGPDPTHPELSETEEFDFDYTSQGPDPTHPELSGAEAAAQWIQSALDESSLSPDHISLHEVMVILLLEYSPLIYPRPPPPPPPKKKKQVSLESQATHMRQQRDHLLQTNREQRERELKAYLANPPPPPPPRAASVHKVAAAPPHSAFSWFKRGRQEDKKLGRTGILCSAIASKLKRNS